LWVVCCALLLLVLGFLGCRLLSGLFAWSVLGVLVATSRYAEPIGFFAIWKITEPPPAQEASRNSQGYQEIYQH
jgi:hypothetical protein